MSTVFTPFHRQATRKFKWFFIGAGLFSWIAATVLVLTPILPHILYRLSPSTPNALAQGLADTASTRSTDQQINRSTLPLPPLDPTLPKTNRLIIPTTGVNGEIHPGTDWEKILRQGIWIVPGFGLPAESAGTPQSGPIILASHRWGYLDWSSSFRKLNSFYSLPKLKDGDQIQIIWNQRIYNYQIYQSENSDHITDYSADLILYTCEFWNSPIRIFRYARRVGA